MRWLVLLLFVVPGAAGQVTYSLDLTADEIPGPVQAESEATWTVHWTVSCEPGGTHAIATSPMHLEFQVDAPDEVVASGPASTVAEAPTCGMEDTNGSADFRLAPTQDAPGLRPLPLHVGASLETSAPQSQTLNASADGALTVAYLGLVHAQAPTAIRQGEPDTQSQYVIRLTNFGNAPSRMVMATEHPDFELPDAPLLDAGESTNVTVTYQHGDEAGLDNRETTAQITITPVSEASSEEGQSVVVNLLARTRSDLAVPAWPLPLAMVALVLLARRRST